MKLEAFSAWPAPWNDEVQRVLALAQYLGIRKLYVKVKLGSLRIQGGGRRLVAAVDAADKATSGICVSCGEAATRSKAIDLPLCPICSGKDLASLNIEWFTRIAPTIEIEAAMHREAAKSLPKLKTSWSIREIDGFSFPTFFTTVVTYAATGEGVLVNFLMGYAGNADDLRTQVSEHIPAYFAEGADVYPRLFVPKGLAIHVPHRIRQFVRAPDAVAGMFSYFSSYRLNRS